MAIDRRAALGLLAGGLAAPLLPRAARAGRTVPLWLSARASRDGGYSVSGFRRSGAAVFDLELPGRGHSFAVSPDGRSAVHFARRPRRIRPRHRPPARGCVQHLRAARGSPFPGPRRVRPGRPAALCQRERFRGRAWGNRGLRRGGWLRAHRRAPVARHRPARDLAASGWKHAGRRQRGDRDPSGHAARQAQPARHDALALLRRPAARRAAGRVPAGRRAQPPRYPPPRGGPERHGGRRHAVRGAARRHRPLWSRSTAKAGCASWRRPGRC